MQRRELLRIGTLGAFSTFFLDACQRTSQPESAATPSRVTREQFPRGDEILKAEVVQRFYPELYAAGIRDFPIDLLETKSRIPIVIYNYAKLPVNLESIQIAYAFAELMSGDKPAFAMANSPRLIEVTTRPGITERVIAITPANLNPPVWDVNPMRVYSNAATDFRQGQAFSYIQVSRGLEKEDMPFDKPEMYATWKLATEICRQVLGITLTNDKLQPVTDAEELDVAETAYYTSVGLALALALTNTPESRYHEFINTRVIQRSVPHTNRTYVMRYIDIPSKTYSAIPPQGSIFR